MDDYETRMSDERYNELRNRIIIGAEFALKSLDIVRNLTNGKSDPVTDAMPLRNLVNHFTVLGLEPHFEFRHKAPPVVKPKRKAKPKAAPRKAKKPVKFLDT